MDGVVNFEEFTKLSKKPSARSGTKPIPPNKLRAIFVRPTSSTSASSAARQRKNANKSRSTSANSVAGSVAGDNDTAHGGIDDTPLVAQHIAAQLADAADDTARSLDSPSTHGREHPLVPLSRSHYSESGRQPSSHHEGNLLTGTTPLPICSTEAASTAPRHARLARRAPTAPTIAVATGSVS